MTNSGYVLVDCTGLDLSDSTEQDIPGIYDRAKAALETGKPCYACNAKWDTMPASPISVVAWMEGTTIVATGHVMRVEIASDDGVTVTMLVS